MQTQSNLKTFAVISQRLLHDQKRRIHRFATNNTKNHSIPSLRNTSYPDTTNYTGYTVARIKQEISNYGKLILTL